MKTTSQNQTYDDPIVLEIRRIRAELAREANYDLHTICERAREAEKKHPERLAENLGHKPLPINTPING